MSKRSGSVATLRAARRVQRRTLLRAAAYGGAALATGPFIGGRAFGQSGEVNVFAWGDYAQTFENHIIGPFEDSTGIKVNFSTYGSNDEAENKLRAAGAEGFDVIFPSVTNGPRYYPDGLLQPIDENKVKVDAIIPEIYRDSIRLGATHRGKRYVLPWDWGTEGITFDSVALPLDDSEVSYGSLWEPGRDNQAAFRQKSVLMGVGLYLDAIGEVQSNRMLDVYKTEEDARRVWDACLAFILERKSNIGAFWNNATEATTAFTDAGCTIGQTWDTTGILLGLEVDPKYKYRGPSEGFLTWVDGIAMPAGAQNVEAAHAFINFILTPENGATFSNNTGYNSCVAGAEEHLNEDAKRVFKEVYTPAVMQNLWWWQAETPWFAPMQSEYVEQITNA
ncbi:MAG TPA: extracellular solute-binding protein [Geminicoccaceae bacterium]